jgi:hypothetical protein
MTQINVRDASAGLYEVARNLERAIADTGSVENATKFEVWLKIIECINADLEKLV